MDVQKYFLMRQALLRCLALRKKWGAAHTSFKRMFNQITIEERGSKEAKKAYSDLIKEGKIMLKKTVEDFHVSLNPRYLKEIMEEIKNSENVY